MSMIIDAITKALNDAYGEEKRPGIPITKGPQMLGSPLNPRAYKLNLVGILPNDADAACEAFGIVWQAVVDVVGADKCVVSTRVRG
ncbi:MAG: hypothetical protein EB060_06330 [Proteobacteria bacterium]|nr:hypothetical protein [Pseudomonadota bacterium]